MQQPLDFTLEKRRVLAYTPRMNVVKINCVLRIINAGARGGSFCAHAAGNSFWGVIFTNVLLGKMLRRRERIFMPLIEERQ